MAQVPSNLIPTTVTQLPEAPVASEDSLMMIVYQGNNYKIRVGDLLSVAGVPTSRQVIAGTGLQGGGQLTANVTLSVAPGGIGSTQLAASGVTAGTYGDGSTIPVFTVDATGRVVSATTIPATISGYVPETTEVIAGTGLTGGGQLTGNVTLDANLSNATPQPTFQAGSAGVSDDISRADHKHPAVNLGVDDEVDGILPLNNGGTARSIVPDAGAIIWCGADGLYVGPVGVAGQVLFSGGTGAYLWVNESDMDVDSAARVRGGAANQILFQSSSGVTAFITAPTSPNTILNWTGSTFNWVSQSGGGGGSGTVTSVDASGGTTGMTFTGGPIVTSGTLTLGGTLAVANGGTGATDAPTARSNLGAAASGANTDITSMASVTGGISSPDFIQFDTATSVTDATGKLYYNNNDQYSTLSVQMNGSQVLHIGEELYYRVKLTAPASKGDVLMFTGTLGASGGLTAAPATGLAADQSNYILGVASETGTTNDWVFVATFGEVKNIDTTGGAESWVQGQILYYNPSVTGGLTKTKPATPNAIAIVAAVVHVSSSSGILFVRPTYGSVLGGTDGNVEFSALSGGDVIVYSSGNSRWQNAAQSTLSVGSAANIVGGGADRIVYNTASGVTAFIAAPTVANTFLEWSGSAYQWSANPLGTVTSVAASGGTTGLTFTGSPITTSGTLTLGGTLALANGGTGQTSAQAAINALAGAVTSGQYLRGNGTNVVMSAIQAADVPTLNQNTTGTAAKATNLAGGGAGRVAYQSGVDTTAFTAVGTAGQVLISAGTGAPAFGNISGGTF